MMTAKKTSAPFLHLIFDLDDTLLDTYRQLIPAASRESCQAMVASGLKATLQECLTERERYVHSPARTDVFKHLVRQFGVETNTSQERVAKAGYEAFHNRAVEDDIELFASARDMLKDLRSHYGLHLVTAGHRATQESKVRILEIGSMFDDIHYVDPSKGERKSQAFAAILKASQAPSETQLSVGNRLDTDIAEAKRLGMQTCWVRYGEYAHLEPQNEFEKPDFTIKNIEELIRACRL
jgi:FMN phosphatase YigB (HAD superfamily)